METETICGLRAAEAVFARRPDDVVRLFYDEAHKERAGPLCAVLAKRRAPYRMLPDDELARAAGTERHGGLVVVAKPRPIGLIDFVRPPKVGLLLVLDSVGNPHNLGAIARSAAFFGVGAMLLHETPLQAMPSPAAHRTAEGGFEWLDLYRTRNLRKALLALAPHYRVVAATLEGDTVAPSELPRDRPLALVLGGEERGVSHEALEACRRRVRIPGSGRVQSLNVAQAAAVLLAALSG